MVRHLQRIYVQNKGSLPNKYSYVTLDIMLTPDPMSQKVLWKIFCPMVHSIVGTPGSSFLARNGETRRWSYSDLSVLIMLTDSFCCCLTLFFLLLSHCCLFGRVWRLQMSKRLQDMILERKLPFLVLDCEADPDAVHVDDGFCGA